MAKTPKKPTPKSQKQIFNDTVEPYIFPETGESYGTPHDLASLYGKGRYYDEPENVPAGYDEKELGP